MTLALLILWAGLLFGGFIFGKIDAERARRMPRWTRLASSLTLAAAAWYLHVSAAEPTAYTFPIAIGMTLGFIGDLFLAGVITGRRDVLPGLGAFGAGHVAYIIGILQYGDQIGLHDSGTRLLAFAVWWIVAVIGWYLAVYRFASGKPEVLHGFALVYAILLSSTAGAATGLALQAGAYVPLAVGAALFLFSDLLIAARMFGKVHFTLIDDVIWLTYGPAQALIVYGAVIAGALTA